MPGKLIPEEAVRGLLARGYNRPDDEVDSAIASLPDASVPVEHPDQTLDELARGALEALNTARVGVESFAAEVEKDEGEEEATITRFVGFGLINLTTAVVYSALAVARAVEQNEVNIISGSER